MLSSYQGGLSYKIKKFLFPLYPIKTFSSTKILSIMAILIALRLVFNLFSIPLPATTQSISFSWVPLMVMGWFFGPVLGFFLGWVTDTLCYLIFTRGLWFWMFAIQEPCVGLISGIFSGICWLRKSENCKLIIDIIIQQIIYIFFTMVCYIALIIWSGSGNPASGVNQAALTTYKYVTLCLITLFILAMESITFYHIKNNKHDRTHLTLFIYGTSLVVLLMEVFSFLLGPISTIQYLKVLTGKTPSGFLKYGLLYYLIPRVIVQSFKVPLESSLLVTIIWSINPSFTIIVNNLNNKWENANLRTFKSKSKKINVKCKNKSVKFKISLKEN